MSKNPDPVDAVVRAQATLKTGQAAGDDQLVRQGRHALTIAQDDLERHQARERASAGAIAALHAARASADALPAVKDRLQAAQQELNRLRAERRQGGLVLNTVELRKSDYDARVDLQRQQQVEDLVRGVDPRELTIKAIDFAAAIKQIKDSLAQLDAEITAAEASIERAQQEIARCLHCAAVLRIADAIKSTLRDDVLLAITALRRSGSNSPISDALGIALLTNGFKLTLIDGQVGDPEHAAQIGSELYQAALAAADTEPAP